MQQALAWCGPLCMIRLWDHESRNINLEETVWVITSSPPYCRQMYTGGKFRCVCRKFATQATKHPISQPPIATYRPVRKDQEWWLKCVTEGEQERLNGLPGAWLKSTTDMVRPGRSPETGVTDSLPLSDGTFVQPKRIMKITLASKNGPPSSSSPVYPSCQYLIAF